MVRQSKLRLWLILCIGLGLSGMFSGLRFSPKIDSEVTSPAYTIDLIPDQLVFKGDVATLSNTVGYCPYTWLANMPAGSIMLGVDPTSCDPDNWNGGSVSTEVFLSNVYSPTLLLLRLYWPAQDGRGLHSSVQNQLGSLALDGRPLWAKRTISPSLFLDGSKHYYAAEHEPILATIVLTQSITQTLTFSVSGQTAWDLSQIELTAQPYPSLTRGIGYSPYRDCQIPGGAWQPSTGDIQEDLFRLFHTANAIRTYGATGVNAQIPALANAQGLPVYAGAWIDANDQDSIEVDALIQLAQTADLEGVIVGNEYYLRHTTFTYTQELLQWISYVKDNVTVPVSTAESESVMFVWAEDPTVTLQGINPEYRPILDEVDFLLVHIYPFWGGVAIDEAVTFVVERYQAIQVLIEQEYPGENKRVIIGETGWPSAGAPLGEAVPSLANQKRYMIEFLRLAEQEGVEYMYFDAFDEPWKIEEPGRVGPHWGYSYLDRTAKHEFYGVLLPAEELPSPPPSRPFYRAYLSYLANSRQSFPVYTEWPMGADFFIPSGWIGDVGNVQLFECDRSDPFRGEMAIRASFSPTGTLGWGGVYWQYPLNNWGEQEEGHDLSWANKLSFRAKGENGGEKVRFFVGGIGTANDPYPDSLRPALSTGFVELEDSWQTYTINLRNQDLSHMIGGFGWVANQCADPTGATFYLDDIFFEYDPNLPPPPALGPTFPVYTDAAAQDNHYVPSGWMGDGAVPGRLSLSECWYDNPHSGETAIRIDYTDVVSGWAGMYWVHPEENWGDRPGGFDLSWANKLTFWARGDQGGEKVQFLVGGIGTENDPYPDSLRPALSTGFIRLDDTWQVYTINLRGQDLSSVVGGFGWVTDQCASPNGATFYLDDIFFEYDPDLPPPPTLGPTFPVYTDAAAQDNHYVPSNWMGDGAVPGRLSLSECWPDNPQSGETAIRIDYTDVVSGWAGIYWVHPAENWGDRPGGFNLTGADRLTFWARSDTPNAPVSFFIGGVGYPKGTDCENPVGSFPDTICPKIEQEEVLTTTWTQYTIDLGQCNCDMSGVVGGFGWSAKGEIIFYLDDIAYEFDP